MFEGQASGTADRVAIARAAHQLVDSPLVFMDPLAIRVLDAADATTLREQPSRQVRLRRQCIVEDD